VLPANGAVAGIQTDNAAVLKPDFQGGCLPQVLEGSSQCDPDPFGPAVLYWYKTVRNPNVPGGAEFVPELIHNRSGAGSHIVATDLNHDGEGRARGQNPAFPEDFEAPLPI